jgi:hypothetical protein
MAGFEIFEVSCRVWVLPIASTFSPLWFFSHQFY